MKKQLLNLSIVLLSLALFSCEREYSGTIDISGYCIDTCGGGPLVNYQVKYKRYLQSFKTTTDAQGYFHIKGDYQFTVSRKEPDTGELEFLDLNNTNNAWPGFVLYTNDLTMHGDTFIGFNTIEMIIRVNLKGISTSNLDTLFLEQNHFYDKKGNQLPLKTFSNSDYHFYYHHKYVGPFTDGQILDTITAKVPAHVGFNSGRLLGSFNHYNQNKPMEDYYLRTPFVPGQSNIGCGEFYEMEVDLR